eukprot:TRINITY_DN908_c0_g1_i5.p1 TRINITY_DN908_c0_g1~~TRINITY_DN908_c0_g1_i5.p1  ORF type:complete len:198 (+),score=14.96 TRINITY_DN908_c0_g1_i5:124-717(+)
MIRRPPRSTLSSSSAASDVYKRQYQRRVRGSHQSAMPKHAATTPQNIRRAAVQNAITKPRPSPKQISVLSLYCDVLMMPDADHIRISKSSDPLIPRCPRRKLSLTPITSSDLPLVQSADSTQWLRKSEPDRSLIHPAKFRKVRSESLEHRKSRRNITRALRKLVFHPPSRRVQCLKAESDPGFQSGRNYLSLLAKPA